MKNLLRDAFPANSVLHAETLRAAAQRSRLYIVFITPRSGSTWLTELAKNTGVLGIPQEWFNDSWIYTDQTSLGCAPPRLRGITDVNQYVLDIVDEAGGTAGLELSVYQALMMREMIGGDFDPCWLTACFYLRRCDIVSQAVSLYRSARSGRFHSYQNGSSEIRAFEAVPFDHKQILAWVEFLLQSERECQALFRSCNLEPTSLFYEDLLSDPLQVLCHMATVLGVEPPRQLPGTSLTIMRDSTNGEWRERFMQNLPQDVERSLLDRRVGDLAGAVLRAHRRGDQQCGRALR